MLHLRRSVLGYLGLLGSSFLVSACGDSDPVQTNQPPALTVSAPADGAEFNEGSVVPITGSATDPEDGTLSSAIAWESSVDGTLGTGADVSRVLAVGSHTLTASVTDSEGARTESTRTVTVLENRAPTLQITAPEDEATLIEGVEATFTATASDPEDGDISSLVGWSSDVDGALGEGAEIQATLSLGSHVVTASVVDAMDAGAEVSIAVEVVEDQPPTLTILSPDDGATGDEVVEGSL